MHISLLDKICCPECKGDLALRSAFQVGDNIKSGVFYCKKCIESYPIKDYIPRFVNSDNYVDSFSLEWSKHSRTQIDSDSGLKVSETQFFERTGFTKGDINGNSILDVGCGSGRFIEIAQKFGGNVVGVDMSFAVDNAYKNVGHLPNVDIVQADILRLPFKDNSFDNVFSLGVLMCTLDASLSFSNISRLVKHSGKCGIWVYSNDGLKMKLYNKVTDFWRYFAIKIKPSIFYKICYISIPLYYVHRIPLLGNITRALLPTSMERLAEWRLLDTFDWYAAKYESKHTYKEVEGWFVNNGFSSIKRLPFPVSMNGVKD